MFQINRGSSISSIGVFLLIAPRFCFGPAATQHPCCSPRRLRRLVSNLGGGAGGFIFTGSENSNLEAVAVVGVCWPVVER